MKITLDFTNYLTNTFTVFSRGIMEDDTKYLRYTKFLDENSVKYIEDNCFILLLEGNKEDGIKFLDNFKMQYPCLAFECFIMKRELENKFFDYDPIGFKEVEVSTQDFDEVDVRVSHCEEVLVDKEELLFKHVVKLVDVVHGECESRVVDIDKHDLGKQLTLFEVLGEDTHNKIEALGKVELNPTKDGDKTFTLTIAINNVGMPISKASTTLFKDTFNLKQLKAVGWNLNRLSSCYPTGSCMFEVVKNLHNYLKQV